MYRYLEKESVRRLGDYDGDCLPFYRFQILLRKAFERDFGKLSTVIVRFRCMNYKVECLLCLCSFIDFDALYQFVG